jgi:hypothetical protein
MKVLAREMPAALQVTRSEGSFPGAVAKRGLHILVRCTM